MKMNKQLKKLVITCSCENDELWEEVVNTILCQVNQLSGYGLDGWEYLHADYKTPGEEYGPN